MDCGWYVNPDIVTCTSGRKYYHGVRRSSYHETHFKDGKAVENKLSYHTKCLRINDTPEIEVHIMDNDEKAGGVGEPGITTFCTSITQCDL